MTRFTSPVRLRRSGGAERGVERVSREGNATRGHCEDVCDMLLSPLLAPDQPGARRNENVIASLFPGGADSVVRAPSGKVVGSNLA